MAGLNDIYRPVPETLRLEEIPQWSPEFLERVGKQLTTRLVYDPKGEATPTIGELSGCDPIQCEALSEGEIRELWRSYSSKGVGFDGIFQMKNPFDGSDYYFYRHGVNYFDRVECRSLSTRLPVSLSRTEAIVLEIWSEALRESNFQACDVDATSGEYFYSVDASDDSWKFELRDSLYDLQKAAQNSQPLPLNIRQEKLDQLQSYLSSEIWKERWLLIGGGLVGLAAPFWIGVGFHQGPLLFQRMITFFQASPKTLLPLFLFPGQETLLYPDENQYPTM